MRFMELYSIGKFAKLIGVTDQTLRNWDKQSKLKPAGVSPGGTRYYSDAQFREFISKKDGNKTRKVIGFCRVDDRGQLKELDRQSETMKDHLKRKNEPFEIINNIGHIEDYGNNGYRELINLLCNKEISTLVIFEWEYNISGFRQSLFRQMLTQLGTIIEIVNIGTDNL